MASREAKKVRQEHLRQMLQQEPLLNDGELARRLNVSIQTVRLDRIEQGIPELRLRTKLTAECHLRNIRALDQGEVIGELLTLELAKEGKSRLKISDEMALQRQPIARGHHLFAHANSLAVAIVNAPVAVTGLARVRYHRPVYIGDTVVAHAYVLRLVGSRYIIRVVSKVGQRIVLTGRFYIIAKN